MAKVPDGAATLNATCVAAAVCGSSGYTVHGSWRACPVDQVGAGKPSCVCASLLLVFVFPPCLACHMERDSGLRSLISHM